MPSRSAKWLRRPLELPASSTSTGGASSSRPPLRAVRSAAGRRAPAPDANPCARVPGRPARSDRPCAAPARPARRHGKPAGRRRPARQRGVGHASRGGLRALRVHVHVGAKEHGSAAPDRAGADRRRARPAPAAPVASRPARVAWVARRAAAKPVGLDARFVGHRDHQQLHLPLTQLIGPVPHQAHALVEHMHAGPGAQAVAVEHQPGQPMATWSPRSPAGDSAAMRSRY